MCQLLRYTDGLWMCYTITIHIHKPSVYLNSWHVFCGKKSDYTMVLKVGQTREWYLRGNHTVTRIGFITGRSNFYSVTTKPHAQHPRLRHFLTLHRKKEKKYGLLLFLQPSHLIKIMKKYRKHFAQTFKKTFWRKFCEIFKVILGRTCEELRKLQIIL